MSSLHWTRRKQSEVSHGSNGSRASDILWEEVLDTTRKGREMWLQTYTGGPVGGYTFNVDANRACEWDRRGSIAIGEETTLTNLPDNTTLWWLHRPNYESHDAVRVFDNDVDVRATYPGAEPAIEHYWGLLDDLTDHTNSQDNYYQRSSEQAVEESSSSSPHQEALHKVTRDRAQKRKNCRRSAISTSQIAIEPLPL